MKERQRMPQRARKKIHHDENTRSKIQVALLINRLQSFALGGDEPDGRGGRRPCIMDAAQIRAAEILLKKVLPDVTSVELSGPEGGDFVTVHRIELVPVRAIDGRAVTHPREAITDI
jgi:hypothetical protein